MFWLLLNSMTVEEFSPPHHFFDKPWSKRWQRNFKSDHHTVLPFQFSSTEVTIFYFYFFKQYITSFVIVNGTICIHESLCRSFHWEPFTHRLSFERRDLLVLAFLFVFVFVFVFVMLCSLTGCFLSGLTSLLLCLSLDCHLRQIIVSNNLSAAVSWY